MEVYAQFLMTFFFNPLCLLLSQLVSDPPVSKQSENYNTLLGEVPLQSQKHSQNFTLAANSCSQRARKFTERGVHLP